MSPPDPLMALLLALVALGLLDQFGLWMERRGWIYWRRRRAQGSALGSTILELQKILESDKAGHLIAVQRDDCKEAATDPAAPLTADHREIDRLLQEARTTLDQGRPIEAHRAVDVVWVRLAVHIRAEHKALFPALAAARPDLQPLLHALREDHDVFMTTLAGIVNSLKGVEVDWAAARSDLDALRHRLAAHNAREEAQVYPQAEALTRKVKDQLAADMSRELTALPPRHRPAGAD